MVKVILGVVIISFSIYSLSGKVKRHLEKDHPILLISSGFCAGVLGGAYGMNGPPLAIYGALRGWSPQHFRATLQAYFLPASLAGLIGYAAIGLVGAGGNAAYFLLSVPGALVATAIGRVSQPPPVRPYVFSFGVRGAGGYWRGAAGAAGDSELTAIIHRVMDVD